MDRYVLIYDLNGEQRQEGFSTKKDRDAKVADLKENRLVRSIGIYEMTEVEQWTRPAPVKEPAAEEAKED